MTVLAWICLLFAIISIVTTTQTEFITRFNQYVFNISGESNAYQKIIEMAREFGYSPEIEPYSYAIGDVMGLVGLVSMSVSWQWMHIYFSGEIKKANEPYRQLLMIAIPLISHLFGMALTAWLLINKAGGEFLNALNYLAINHPESLPFQVTGGGYLNFVIASFAANTIIATLISLSFVFSALGILFVFYFVTRILFAWAFDRVFPVWLSDVNERLHAPVKATIVFVILNIVGGLIVALWPDFLLPFFAAAGSGSAIFAWIPISITAIVFPFIRRDIYNASPLRRLNVKGIPIVSLFGIIALIYCSYIAYSFLVIFKLFGWRRCLRGSLQ